MVGRETDVEVNNAERLVLQVNMQLEIRKMTIDREGQGSPWFCIVVASIDSLPVMEQGYYLWGDSGV